MRPITMVSCIATVLVATTAPALAANDLATFNRLLSKTVPSISALTANFKPKQACVCFPGDPDGNVPGVVAHDDAGRIMCFTPQFHDDGRINFFSSCGRIFNWMPLPK